MSAYLSVLWVTSLVKKAPPHEEIIDDPAILLPIGVEVRDGADADHLSVVRKVRRSMLHGVSYLAGQ
jgi:hypothetical protein